MVAAQIGRVMAMRRGGRASTTTTRRRSSYLRGLRGGAGRGSALEVVCGETSAAFATGVRVSADAMKAYRAPLFVRMLPRRVRGHAETIMPSVLRRGPKVEYEREVLRVPDGGCITLDWPPQRERLQGRPLCVLLPGLAGGSNCAYVRRFVVSAIDGGFMPVVFNSRGCADSPVTSAKFYSASYTGDMRFVVANLRERFGESVQMFSIGWLLGANILVNYLAEEGKACPLRGAASVGNPFDLSMCSSNLARPGIGKFYDKMLARGLTKIFAKHAPLFRGKAAQLEGLDAELAQRAATVRDFDVAITAPSFGHPSVEAYYEVSGSAQRVADVRIPTLCIQAQNDPISLDEAIPRDAIEANECMALLVTETGGHIGWACSGTGGFFGFEGNIIDITVLQFWQSSMTFMD